MINRSDLAELDYGATINLNAFIRALGMHAENQRRLQNGEAIAYGEDDFNRIIEENGITHNNAITRWYP